MECSHCETCAGYVRSLGFSLELLPANNLLAVPVRHQGIHLGNFFVAAKDGGSEFTSEDEEVLVLFASQAAAAIANARTHRHERRTRANLEALVETSPVGVVVCDPSSGRPVSFNREAKRIFGRLCMPRESPEELLNVVTVRRGDGRELALAELSLAQAVSSATTMRAEEVVLEVPDGRALTTMVNALPILAEDGTVESVVVTMQDLAPIEELERLRAEFLGMVSHELRAPLAAIKGSAATVLGASSPLDPAEILQFFRIVEEQADHMHGLISDLLDAGRIEAGTLSVNTEAADVAELVEKARQTFLGTGRRNAIQVDLPPDLPAVIADPQRVVQVLNNLFSNASNNSPEALPIRVGRKARRRVPSDFRVRRGPGYAAGPAAANVPEVRPDRPRPRSRDPRVGPWPRYMQGLGGGPRGADLGRKRRDGPRCPVHVHPADRRREAIGPRGETGPAPRTVILRAVVSNRGSL